MSCACTVRAQGRGILYLYCENQETPRVDEQPPMLGQAYPLGRFSMYTLLRPSEDLVKVDGAPKYSVSTQASHQAIGVAHR